MVCLKINVRKIFNIFKKEKYNTEIQEIVKKQKEPDEPWFYCTLCNKFMKYDELINGCKCRHCSSDLFVVPWNEFTDLLDSDIDYLFTEGNIAGFCYLGT